MSWQIALRLVAYAAGLALGGALLFQGSLMFPVGLAVLTVSGFLLQSPQDLRNRYLSPMSGRQLLGTFAALVILIAFIGVIIVAERAGARFRIDGAWGVAILILVWIACVWQGWTTLRKRQRV